MSNWKEQYLEEAVEVDPELLGSSTNSDYSFFYIDISSVSQGYITYPSESIKFQGSPSRARKILRQNDILMSNVRPNLKAFAQFKLESKYNFIASTGFSILRAKPNVDINFIYHNLFSTDLEKQFELLVAGTAYPAINSSAVRKLRINLPLPEEQQRIAKILSTADAVIEKTQSAIAKYKAIKQGLLQDLFTRGIDPNTNKLRPRCEDAPELYKESKLGMVPKEWDVKQLGDLCSMKSGDGITSEKIYELGDYPVYGGNGLRGYTTKFTHDGEFTLIGRQGALCGNITRVSGKFYASEHAVVVTPENFIELDWLSQKLYSMNLNQYSEATAQPGLSVFKILPLLVETPPFDEQQKIAGRLKAIDNKLQTEQTYLQKMQSLKKGLMEDLLSGKKRLNLDLQDEQMSRIVSGNLQLENPVNPKIK
jgi:type I restriction enzyme S subunit